jgi:rare lipoprotein A
MRYLLTFLILGYLACDASQYKSATYYHNKLTGRKMADGTPYNPKHYTCASYDYPLGTMIRVTNVKTNKEVIVRVTDRHDYKTDLDLSLISYLTLRGVDRIHRLDPGRITVKTERIKG